MIELICWFVTHCLSVIAAFPMSEPMHETMTAFTGITAFLTDFAPASVRHRSVLEIILAPFRSRGVTKGIRPPKFELREFCR